MMDLSDVLHFLTVLGAGRVNAPENNRIRGLDTDERPDYTQASVRWRRAHVVRASSGLLAFVAFTMAAVASS